MAKKTAKKSNNEQLTFSDYELKEVSVRLVLNEQSSLYSSTPLRTAEDAVKVVGELLRGMDREHVLTINLDNKLRPINYHTVSIGNTNSAMVPIANCFKSALLANGSGVILLHCHPSGDATPSQEDFDVTKRFVQAGKLLDIPALDHIIIGAYQGEKFSFRGNYPDMFYAEPDLSVFPEMDTSKGWHAAERKTTYESGDEKQNSERIINKDSEKKSVIGRLSEKKEKLAVMDRAAAIHTKKEYSL